MNENNIDVLNLKDQITLNEALEILGVTYNTALGYVRSGKLHSVKKAGIYLLSRKEVEKFKPPIAGRPRKSVPAWRISPKDNEQVATSVEGQLREGVDEKEFIRALRKVQRDERLRFMGTIARYVLSAEREPRRVQFLFIWREGVMDAKKSAETLKALQNLLAPVLDWEHARTESLRVWMHT